MKKSVLIMKKHGFIYRDKEYLFEQFEEIEKLMSRNREFIILEEELYSRHFTENIRKSHIYEYIEFKLNKEFHKNDDILYHYEYDKKNELISIYSVKGGNRLEVLSKGSKNIKVIPIQFIIKDVIIDSLGKDALNSNCIVYFHGFYYYVELVNGKFNRAFVENELDNLINRINDFESLSENKESTFYIDKNIKNKEIITLDNVNKEIKIMNVNCEVILYEKIYKKRELHSEKIL
ncbi:hypothetical protein FDB28_12435 [Clostridium botulinum]|uniref:hypothetical protein n=1 Tax=unclassified Clostridium TaxID=2614128 RepID=UPI00030C8E0F|nr:MULTISPECIES: hypothetical protein [unclassified Clostridium]MBN1055839.1 hypothetical protein [Clostridium botulinum]NFN94875.1 hypothetical protein [Clostridium botulinum]NFS28968.1 hypothetical protein [Clostridium botulinum]NFS52990.1 hypothetical protein [Clostridium botulinum]NFS95900.1 hypothetical protein [Clostridium botulinum]